LKGGEKTIVNVKGYGSLYLGLNFITKI